MYLRSSVLFFYQDAQGLLEESRSLEKKVHLASEAQKAAKDVEQDYAEVRDCNSIMIRCRWCGAYFSRSSANQNKTSK